MVLVDTSVWSLALRRKREELGASDRRVVSEWAQLVRDGRAQLIGLIRQEILSGVRSEKQFQMLEQQLSAFLDIPVDAEDHVRAARFFNQCRSTGVAASHVDMLICALSHRHGDPVFTVDKDFTRYAQILPIGLHKVAAPSSG